MKQRFLAHGALFTTLLAGAGCAHRPLPVSAPASVAASPLAAPDPDAEEIIGDLTVRRGVITEHLSPNYSRVIYPAQSKVCFDYHNAATGTAAVNCSQIDALSPREQSAVHNIIRRARHQDEIPTMHFTPVRPVGEGSNPVPLIEQIQPRSTPVSAPARKPPPAPPPIPGWKRF